MKKYNRGLLALTMILAIIFNSCGNETLESEDNELIEKSSIASSEEDVIEHLRTSVVNSRKTQNDISHFENLNSEYFVESQTKAANTTLYAYGFDSRKVLEKAQTTFYYQVDNRIVLGVPYYTEYCEYTKYVEIPAGYSFVSPPPTGGGNIYSVNELLPSLRMGYVDRGAEFVRGYIIKHQGTVSGKEKYALITYTTEFTKNMKTNALLSPPVYSPNSITPSQFEFRYQYRKLNWN